MLKTYSFTDERFNAKQTKDSMLQEFVSVLQNNETERMKLSYNQFIGDQGITLLSKYLTTNTTLKSLNIAYCNICDEGVVALAGALEMNTNLEELIMYGNPVGSQGMLAIARMLQTNTSLTRIDAVGVCGALSDEVYRAMRLAVQKNKKIVMLRLSYEVPRPDGKDCYSLLQAEIRNNRLQ